MGMGMGTGTGTGMGMSMGRGMVRMSMGRSTGVGVGTSMRWSCIHHAQTSRPTDEITVLYVTTLGRTPCALSAEPSSATAPFQPAPGPRIPAIDLTAIWW